MSRELDAGGLQRFLDALEAAREIDPHSLIVLRHGRQLAAGWWSPYTADRPHLLYSLSKSFTSTAAGLAVAEGRFGLDDRVVDHFPELGITDAGTATMLVRHLASMATGHITDMWPSSRALDFRDPVRGFLLQPPHRPPGSVFAYNQSATHTLATIVQRTTGQTLTEYLRPRLFGPLGIGTTSWLQFPPGQDLGFSGLHAHTDAIARLGQLYLQRGRWDGRQLLPAEWVDEATSPQIATPNEPEPDWRQGYGFQFWGARHGYRGDGAYGQFCLVLPEQDAVIAITADAPDMQLVLDVVWAHLLPAFDGADDPAADAAVSERLARLALPVADPVSPVPATVSVSCTPAGGRCVAQPSLTAIELTVESDGCRLTLVEGEVRLPLRVGRGEWAVTEGRPPMAASGGWADGVLTAAVLFLETPHRLLLTVSPADRTFDARWRSTPLHEPRLARMCATG